MLLRRRLALPRRDPWGMRRLSSGRDTRQACTVRSPEQMEALGASVASVARSAGDVLFLKGDLGCGKTCFARGFIRALSRDSGLHVTSPTYLLVNTYDAWADTKNEQERRAEETSVIHHIDLYRLDTVSDVDAHALGLTSAFSTGISLVEWPQRLDKTSVPSERLEVCMAHDPVDASVRHVRFLRYGDRWRDVCVALPLDTV